MNDDEHHVFSLGFFIEFGKIKSLLLESTSRLQEMIEKIINQLG